MQEKSTNYEINYRWTETNLKKCSFIKLNYLFKINKFKLMPAEGFSNLHWRKLIIKVDNSIDFISFKLIKINLITSFKNFLKVFNFLIKKKFLLIIKSL